MLFFGYAFLLLVTYYILRTLREPLLLTSASAEVKTYASAAAAVVLVVLVPLYGVAFRRADRSQLVRWVTGVFVGTLGALYVARFVGVDVGFVYYVWVSIFGVAVIAQFWAHAADCFDAASGRRLFPAIMMGATLGGLVGPALFRALHGVLDASQMMIVAMTLLLLTLPFAAWTRSSVPTRARAVGVEHDSRPGRPLGGFSLLLRDRYLLLLAALVVLLNCVNTMGEYLLTDIVVRHASEQVALHPWLDKGELIGEFYASFFFSVNAVTVIAQLFLVGRVFRWVGVNGALLVLPIIALIGYGVVAFLPIFGLLRVVKVLENAGDYSVMNTARQALFLPLSTEGKYEGKIATDTFFWRFGDLLPAAIVFVGLNYLHFEARQFALVNLVLCVAWLAVTVRLARCHSEQPRRRAGRPFVESLAAGWARLQSGLEPVVGAARAFAWFGIAIGMLAVGAAMPSDVAAAAAPAVTPGLFESHEPLVAEIVFDFKELCRNPERKGCVDIPATFVYRDDLQTERRLAIALRTRGRYRADTVECDLPALFVLFTGDARDTLFAGETMLPLTTHCQRGADYEQYVLKEYLAYRIYNLLTTKSLRVRLMRVTYRDEGGRFKPIERYAFFTEHFDALAGREGAVVSKIERFDPLTADPEEIATLDLFEYAIGNTDWSVVYGHNVLLLEAADGLISPVPFDFDFSGLVNARYASPPPQLRINSVRERVFRGVCRADTNWERVFARFTARRADVLALPGELVALDPRPRADAVEYLQHAFETFATPGAREKRIIEACRAIDAD